MSRALVIDTSYLIYRSYFAYPRLTHDGQPTGALHGFVKAVLGMIREYQPTDLIFAMDTPEATWRHEIYLDYKAGRAPREEAMKVQVPWIEEWCGQVGSKVCSQAGFEADDFIYTIAQDCDCEVFIFSSDRDLYQLFVLPHLCFVQAQSSAYSLFRSSDFETKYVLKPRQWIDYKTLVGDASDNLPGLPGVGPKTATGLLHEAGSLYYIFEALGQDPALFEYSKLESDGHSATRAGQVLQSPKYKSLGEKIFYNQQLLNMTYELSRLKTVPGYDYTQRGFELLNGVGVLERFGLKSLLYEMQKMRQPEPVLESLF